MVRLQGSIEVKSGRTSPGQIAVRRRPLTWYLDPLVAAQKKEAHIRLIERALDGTTPSVVLKTDLFEEASGQDQLLFDLSPIVLRVGIDVSFPTVSVARQHAPASRVALFAADVRRLPLRNDSVDLVISTSTLDHLDTASEMRSAVREIARVLGPGGKAVITLDNPRNPLYWLLRLGSRLGLTPFPLGRTASLHELSGLCRDAGLEIVASEYLIHNPRVISTLGFLAMRKMLGELAGPLIGAMLRLFALAGQLPTRSYTACFVGLVVRKPAGEDRI